MARKKSVISRVWRVAAMTACAVPLLYSVGCGGSMGSSAFGWDLSAITAYGGNPTVTIAPALGAATTGGFTVPTSSAETRAGDTIFVEAIYAVEVPNVNSAVYTGAAPQAVGTFSVVWSEVLPTADSTPRVTFNSPVGTTFTGDLPSATPNVRVTGDSGDFITVSSAGPVTLKLHVTFQASDGSAKSKDFFTTLDIIAPAGA